MKYYKVIGYKNNELVFQSRLMSNIERMIELKSQLSKEFSEILFATVGL